MTTDQEGAAEAAASNDAANGATDAAAELDELRAKYMRAVADYQNLRRRNEEDRREHARYTLAALVLNYLPVLDDLRRALESVPDEIAEHQWVEGVRMVERKFRGVLEGAGVKEIAAEGTSFDPAVHEAVSYGPGPEGQVVQLVRPGYELDGRVIRAASVIVGNGVPAPGQTDNNNTENAPASAGGAAQTTRPAPGAGAEGER